MTTDVRVEKWLFIMPADAEEFLCAIAAIQGLVEEIGKRKIEPEILLYCPNADTTIFVPALGPKAQSITVFELDHMVCRQFDLVFEFDTRAAKKISANTARHLSQAYSILLGGAPHVLPDLTAIKIHDALYMSCDIILLPWAGALKLSQMVELNASGLETVLVDKPLSLAQLYVCVVKSKMVVGPQSAATMMAASLGKGVVEICPPSKGHREWLSKWGIPGYSMIYMEEADVQPAMVYKSMERACHQLLLAREGQMRTVQST